MEAHVLVFTRKIVAARERCKDTLWVGPCDLIHKARKQSLFISERLHLSRWVIETGTGGKENGSPLDKQKSEPRVPNVSLSTRSRRSVATVIWIQ